MIHVGPMGLPKKTRNWNALNPEYRARLARGGITRADYNRGVSLSAARGHASAPENPNRTGGESYESRRRALARELTDLKRQLWGTSPNWNERNAKAKSTRGGIKALRAAIATLQGWVNGEEIEWEDLDDDVLEIIGYHGE